jgi:hypothetical protein
MPSYILYNTVSLSLSRYIPHVHKDPLTPRPDLSEDALLTEFTHHNVIYGIVAPTSPIMVPTCQRKWLWHCESLAQKIGISEHKAPITAVIIPQHNNTRSSTQWRMGKFPPCSSEILNLSGSAHMEAYVLSIVTRLDFKTGSGLGKISRYGT